MRIPLVAGSPCRDEASTTTVMVNRRFAEVYLGGSAVGRQLRIVTNASLAPGEVRGVVGDARETGLDREPVPTVYWCSAALQPGLAFVARTRVDPRSLAETVRRRLAAVEPGRSVYELTPLSDHVADAYGENRLRAYLLGSFSLAALALACLGLYGTLNYLVQLRQRELALRLALGAARGQVVRQVLLRGLRVAGAGCASGVVLVLALGRLLTGMLFGVTSDDPATLTGTVGLVMVVSAAASLLPAARASRLDPMRLLREE
jgi:putative ABC transport system permease protein